MKKLAIISLLLFSCIESSADKNGPDGSAANDSSTRDGGFLEKYPGPCAKEHHFPSYGEIEAIDTYKYDDNGNMVSTEYDEENDGKTDSIVNYIYDDNDRLIRTESDNNADGTIDGRTTYTYDDEGNVSKREGDIGLDGTIDRIETYEYDDKGGVTNRRYDLDADGVPDMETEYKNKYDGNALTEACSGYPDETVCNYYEYDADGNLIRETRKECEPTGSSTGYCSPTNTVEITEYSYDSHGNILSETYEDVETQDITLYVYTYECWK